MLHKPQKFTEEQHTVDAYANPYTFPQFKYFNDVTVPKCARAQSWVV